MNLRHLEYLLAVAETGSFSRAAESSHITQSALSRSIQALEDELGGRLIDRVGKRNELTPFGREVARRARRMVLDAAELRRSAQFLRDGEMGSIRIGLGSGPSALLKTPFLQHMARQHPGVEVSISAGTTELQVAQLRQRELDALVVDMRRVAPAPDLVIEQLCEMRAGFICRTGHPLLQIGRPVTLDELRRYPLASTPLSDEASRILVTHYGPQAHPETCISLRCDDIPSLLATVQASDAVFLGTLSTARDGMATGALAELPMAPAFAGCVCFAFVTLAARTEAPAMAIFRRFVAEHLRD